MTAVEHFDMSKEHPMGFGWKVTLLTVVLLPILYFYLKKQFDHRKSKSSRRFHRLNRRLTSRLASFKH
jgi:hypothetical protein